MAHGPIGDANGGVQPIDIKIEFLIGSSRMQTGFSLRPLAALLATPQDAAQHVATNIVPGIQGILSNLHTVTGVDAVNAITKEGGSVSLINTHGGSNSELRPGFVTAVASFKGELRTRQGQGRMLLPCVLGALYTFETLNGAGLSAYGGLIDALTSNYVGGGVGKPWGLINWHRTLPANRQKPGKPPLAEVPAAYYDVTSIRLNPNVSYLQRRKQGVGS